MHQQCNGSQRCTITWKLLKSETDTDKKIYLEMNELQEQSTKFLTCRYFGLLSPSDLLSCFRQKKNPRQHFPSKAYFERKNEIDFPIIFSAIGKGPVQRYSCWRLKSRFCHHKSWLYPPPPPPPPVWTTPSPSHVLKYSVNKSFTNHSRLPQRREKKPWKKNEILRMRVWARQQGRKV